MRETENFDVIIVGAGPAGAVTAQHIHNKSIALFERRSQPASVCAGGLNSSWLESIHNLDGYTLPKNAIQIPIKSARINTPHQSLVLDAAMINQEQLGYVVDRSVFDRDLLDRASDCDYHPNEKVIDCKQNDCVFAVTTEKGIYSALIVVDASGAQAFIGSQLGLPVALPDWCMHTAVQYVVDLPSEKDPYELEFWFDADKIPSGYVWSFPCGNGRTKLGVGIDRTVNYPRKILDQFVQDHPEWSLDKIYKRSAGLIPTGKMVFSTITDCYLVGDANRLCSPLTGGGIYGAYVSGYRAGKCITENRWRDYKSDVLSTIGPMLRKHWLGKKLLYSMNNEMLDSLCSLLAHYKPETINFDRELRPLVRYIIRQRPQLCFDTFLHYILFSFLHR